MPSVGFYTLGLLVVVGLAGPLLASIPHLRVPVVVGELLAGIAVGRTGFGIIDDTNPTLMLLANVGFALVMFIVGTHVPVHDSALRSAIPWALARAVLVGAVAAGFGAGTAAIFATGHASLYAVLMASSSAALALPVIDGLGLEKGPQVLSVTAQIAIADTACIVLLPLVLDPSGAARAALGAAAVGACAVAVYIVLWYGERTGRRKRLHKISETRRWALELRISLAILFGLSALAVATHVSIMLSGFALGLVLAAIGEPRRLARQLFGITEGFFSPLFFVWLGASLQVRDLGAHPWLILLGVALGAGAILAHAAGSLLKQPLALAVLSSAQLGVPVAAATIGTQTHLLRHGEPAALMLGALLAIAATSVAATIAARVKSTAPEPNPRDSED
jgi:Kef-type K+ transport system membrane component KefB